MSNQPDATSEPASEMPHSGAATVVVPSAADGTSRAGVPSGATPADYNPFFERLVEKTKPDTVDELIGMLAYARYKSIKCEWTKKFRAANNQAWPSRETVQIFLDAHLVEKNLAGFLAEAEKQLYQFAEWYADQIVEQKKDELRRDAIAQQLSADRAVIVQVVKESNTFGRALWINFLSSVLFAAVIVILTLFAVSQKNPGALRDLFLDHPQSTPQAREMGETVRETQDVEL